MTKFKTNGILFGCTVNTHTQERDIETQRHGMPHLLLTTRLGSHCYPCVESHVCLLHACCLRVSCLCYLVLLSRLSVHFRDVSIGNDDRGCFTPCSQSAVVLCIHDRLARQTVSTMAEKIKDAVLATVDAQGTTDSLALSRSLQATHQDVVGTLRTCVVWSVARVACV